MPESDPNPKIAFSSAHISPGSYALLCKTFDDFEVGVSNVLPSGEIIYANPKFTKILRAQLQGMVVGKNLRDFVAPRSWGALENVLRQASKGPVTSEIKVHSLSENTQTVRLSMSPSRLLENLVIRVVADEVTELVETNSQLRETEGSLRALSGRILQVQDQERRKLARDLHDTTGQELAFLTMSLRQLADTGEQLGGDTRKALVEAADLARKVNDDIRTVAYVLHPPLLDELGLGPALHWYVEGFSKRSNIDVKLTVPGDLRRFPAEVETVLFRVVQEGLTNILRHSGGKSAEIVVRPSAERVELTVKDQGKGLSAADVKRLAPSGGSKDVGVGIAGLRERLHQLGGTLDISSKGHGTTLKAVIQTEGAAEHFAPSLPETRTEPAGAPVVPSDTSNRRSILIVDDHDVIRRGIRGLLENEADLEICGEAANGLEAVQKTRELHPELIILDLNMPNFGGIYAASQLLQNGPSIKILVFSMHDLPGMESMLRSAGCKGFVSKVHGERDLLRGIRAVLDGGEFFNSRGKSPNSVV